MDRLPTYHRLDLRASHQVTPTFNHCFEVINACARKNVAGYSYAADYKSRTPVTQLGFTPSVRFNYKL